VVEVVVSGESPQDQTALVIDADEVDVLVKDTKAEPHLGVYETVKPAVMEA
jgi:hypothetical protein